MKKTIIVLCLLSASLVYAVPRVLNAPLRTNKLKVNFTVHDSSYINKYVKQKYYLSSNLKAKRIFEQNETIWLNYEIKDVYKNSLKYKSDSELPDFLSFEVLKKDQKYSHKPNKKLGKSTVSLLPSNSTIEYQVKLPKLQPGKYYVTFYPNFIYQYGVIGPQYFYTIDFEVLESSLF